MSKYDLKFCCFASFFSSRSIKVSRMYWFDFFKLLQELESTSVAVVHSIHHFQPPSSVIRTGPS